MSFLRRDDQPDTQYELVGKRATVGRDRGSDVLLAHDMSISRHHAILEEDGGSWTIKDNDSANGTFVNGQRTAHYPLRDGDRIRLGNTVLVYLAGNDPFDTVTEGDVSAAGPDDRTLLTLLFTDIVGSTEQAIRLGDQQWRSVLDRHDLFVRQQVHRFRGRFIKHTGDGMLACFDSPARGIRCASAVRDGVRAFGLEVRSGLHTGEVELRGDDLAGMAVHVAARIVSLAGPGEILVSGTVPLLAAGSGIEFDERGEHQLKGVPGSWWVGSVR